jgi:hypothetical protein
LAKSNFCQLLTVSILRNRGGDIVLALGNARVSVGRTMAHLIKVTKQNNANDNRYHLYCQAQLYRGLCINRNDWQNPIFAHLVISTNECCLL